MHCPNCGTKTSTEHKYCRACGLGLEKFALLLAEQLPEGEAGRAGAEALARRAGRSRWVENILTAALFTFIACLVGVILYGIVGKLIIEKGEVLRGIIFLFVILLGLGSVRLVSDR